MNTSRSRHHSNVAGARRPRRLSRSCCIAFVTLLTAIAAESARAQFCPVNTLTRGIVETDNGVSPRRYRIVPLSSRWIAVAVRPLGGDWDLHQYDASAPSPACVAGLVANSHRSFGVDVVVGDFNHIPLATKYPVAIRGAGSVAHQIEWDEGKALVPNGAWEYRDVGSSDILDVWDIGLEAGVSYRFEFLNNADCRMLLFRNPSNAPYWAARDAAVADVLSTIQLTMSATDRYAVVVINETGAPGSYALRVAACVAGEIRELSSDTSYEAIPSLSYYSFMPVASAWSAVAVRGAFSDWDLYVARSFGSSNFPACNTEQFASSVGTNRTEFVVGDFNPGGNPLEAHFVTLNQKAGVSAGTVKWEGGGESIVVGEPAVVRQTDTVLEAWDVQLEAGRQYTVDFSRIGTDAQFYLFHNPGGPYWGTRSDAVLSGSLATVYTAPSTGAYGLVVVHENSDDGSYAVGVCGGNLPSLTSGIVEQAAGPSSYRFRQLRAYWAAAGVRSAAGVWNIVLRHGACDLGALLADSESAGGRVDFVIGDFNHVATGDYSAQVSRVTGTSNAIVEWDDGGDQIIPDMPPTTRTTGANDLLEVWDVFLTAGRPYSIYFARQGAADTKLLLFQNQGGAMLGARGDALIETQDMYTNFTPATSDFYGLVVVNDNGAFGRYGLAVANTVTDVEASVSHSASALRGVAPNPSAGAVRIDFVLKDGGTAIIDIIDVAGRVVASRSAPASRAGTNQIEWNGRDARGRQVPAGIYWARLSAAGRAIGTRKFLLVR